MDLTPKLLTEGTDFQQVRRGYDPDEVDDFLERVAAAVSRLQGQLVEANRRAETAESSAEPPQTASQAAARPRPRTPSSRRCSAPSCWPSAPPTPPCGGARGGRFARRRRPARGGHHPHQRAPGGRPLRRRVAPRARHRGARARGPARRAATPTSARSSTTSTPQRSRLRTAVEELQRIVDDPDAFRVERPAGIEEPAPQTAQAAPEPLPMPMPEPPPEPASSPTPSPRSQPEPEPLPAPPFPADPEPVPVAETAPVEVVTTAPDEDRGVRPTMPAARAEAQMRRSPSRARFGPPPGGRADDAVAADGVAPGPAAEVETEPGSPSGPGDQLIDLTHEREMPEGQEEDAFLAELRKAMTDDEPLGPREEQPGVVRTIGEVPLGRQRGRFGRRR